MKISGLLCFSHADYNSQYGNPGGHGRREFLNLTGGGIAALVGGAWPGTTMAAEGQYADLVVFNAKVYTLHPLTPKVEAFPVKAPPVQRPWEHRAEEGAHRQCAADLPRQTDCPL